MRFIYTLLFYLSLPFIFLRLLWRARKNPGYAQQWSQRLGFAPLISAQNSLWIHAVSVGEVLAAVPLIKKLQQKYPHYPIVVTTTTPTGADRVKAAFAKVTHCYAPYDLPGILKRLIARIKPRVLILMETELWPNTLHVCRANNVPVLLANARLSPRSARGYGRLGSLTREMLNNIQQMAVQTQVEKDRYVALGFNAANAEVTGSIKYDLEIPADLAERAKTLKNSLGNDRVIWIAASTHEGEEEIILNAFKEIRKKIPNALLILVPRHPERFAPVAELARKNSFNVVLRSAQQHCTSNTDVFIGDTMGELLLFYAISDVAYVGGSLVEKGGQNPLEPAALGLPVIMGPHLFNFAAITDQLISAQAMIKINEGDELAINVITLLEDAALRQQMGEHGRNVVAKNRGALQKHLVMIEKLLSHV